MQTEKWLEAIAVLEERNTKQDEAYHQLVLARVAFTESIQDFASGESYANAVRLLRLTGKAVTICSTEYGQDDDNQLLAAQYFLGCTGWCVVVGKTEYGHDYQITKGTEQSPKTASLGEVVGAILAYCEGGYGTTRDPQEVLKMIFNQLNAIADEVLKK